MRNFRLEQTDRVAAEALLRGRSGGGGGAGITQLTGEVIAGPGAGSQVAKMGPRPVASQAVQVNQGGNDGTGNGTPGLPFLTIGAALASITDASSSKTYSVVIGPGEYDENITLPAFVFLDGEDPSNVPLINGTVALGFTNADDFGGFSDLAFEGAVTANYTQAGQNAVFFNCIFEGTFASTGVATSNLDSFILCFFIGASVSFTSVKVQSQGNNFEASVSFSSGASVAAAWESLGDAIHGGLTVNGTATAATVNAIGSGLSGTLTLNGADVAYSATITGFPTTIVRSGGAPAPTLFTSAIGLEYTPAVLANWSGSAPTSVANALDRIAAKIAPIP